MAGDYDLCLYVTCWTHSAMEQPGENRHPTQRLGSRLDNFLKAFALKMNKKQVHKISRCHKKIFSEKLADFIELKYKVKYSCKKVYCLKTA